MDFNEIMNNSGDTLPNENKEVVASSAIKTSIALEPRLIPRINENNTIPLWDGEVDIYSVSEHNNADRIGGVRVQVKWRNVKYKTNDRKTYHVPIKVSHINNYIDSNETTVLFAYIPIGDRSYKIVYHLFFPHVDPFCESNIDKNTKEVSLLFREYPYSVNSKVGSYYSQFEFFYTLHFCNIINICYESLNILTYGNRVAPRKDGFRDLYYDFSDTCYREDDNSLLPRKEGFFSYWKEIREVMHKSLYIETIRLPRYILSLLINLIELPTLNMRLTNRPCNNSMKKLIDAQKSLIRVAKDLKNVLCYFEKHDVIDKNYIWMPDGHCLTNDDLSKIQNCWILDECGIISDSNPMKIRSLYKLILAVINELVMHLVFSYNFLLFYYRQNCQQFYLWEGDFGGEPCSVVSLSSSSEKFPVISPYLNYFYSGWLNPQIEIEKKDILFHPENYRPYSKLSDLASELVWTNLNLSGLRELIHSSPSI